MRILIALALSLGTTAFLPACGQQGNNRELELSYLRSAVATDILEYAQLEIPALDNISQGSDARGSHLGLRTFRGQKLRNGGVRAEISVDFPFVEGDVVRYGWRFKVPTDFTPDPANRWWLIAQWHDQPNRNKGETWDGYPHHSPSVGLGYGVIDGKDQLSLLYGAPEPVSGVKLIPFTRGVWHDIAVEILWSRGPSGRVRIYLDGAKDPVCDEKGRNMYNDFQQYLKLGMYRHPDIGGDSWLFVGDVNVRKLPRLE